MSQTPAPDFEAVIDAMAPLLGLAVAPEFRPGIVQNLATILRLAAVVLEAEIDEREEPAPVFRP